MKVNDWLTVVVRGLEDAGIQTARLDALVLLENATGIDRAKLLANPDQVLDTEVLHDLADQVERRLTHEPLAYIVGTAEFYGRRFSVTPDVLVPRPESETIIELVKSLATGDEVIADIGTGSGALAITTALELPSSQVFATDIDAACIAMAKHNAQNVRAEINTVTGNLLEPFLQPNAQQLDIILANLPYVPDDYPVNEAATHEPALALFSGTDGLDAYRELFRQVTQFTHLPKFIITEALPEQHRALTQIAAASNYNLQEQDDFIQVYIPKK